MRFLNSVSTLAIIAAGTFAAGAAQAQTAINLNALQGLVPVSVLGNTAAGKAVLSSNYATTFAIQNGTDNQPLLLSFAAQEEKALQDATLTTTNAYQLSDALGTSLSQAYKSLTTYTSTNDGLTVSSTNVSPAVANLIAYTYSISGSDSNAGKYFFANETTNGTTPVSNAAKNILTAAGGVTNVLGTAYPPEATPTPTQDPFGDSRPYQTEPSVKLYTGTDFFGVASGNSAYLNGPAQNLNSSPSFPSGHTTYGYTQSTLLAILVPQRFQQMITRGAEYGNDRIVLGAHYTLDVIAGRTLAYYDIAQMLAENPTYVGQTEGGVTINNYQNAVTAAQSSLDAALSTACGNTLAACAANDTGEFSNSAANKAFYESTQTYGLPVVYQATASKVENVATVAPEAGYLLETRFPYLSLAQADDVLTSTEGPGGGFLDNGSAFGLYSRLDLYSAADGYASFASNVAVTMNAAQGGYSAADSWNNNISGTGGFTLNGTGKLTFTGADTYTGLTAVNGGDLAIDGSLTSPITVNAGGMLSGTGTLKGAVTVNSGGTLAPGDDPGTLTTTAPVTLNAGSTSVFDIDGTGTGTGAGSYSRVVVNGATYTAGGTLEPLLRGITGSATNTYTPVLGTDFQIVSASGGVTGTYTALVQPTGLAAGTEFATVYGPDTITLAVTPADYGNLAAFGVALTPDEEAVALALDAGRTAGASSALYGPVYTASLAAEPGLFDQLSPAVYGDDLLAIRDGFDLQSNTIEAQLDSRRDGLAAAGAQSAAMANGSTIWVAGTGQFFNVTSNQAPGYNGSLGGVAAGVDTLVAPGARFGAAIEYLHQNVSAKNASTANGDTVQGTLYGSITQGIFFTDAQASVFGLEGSASRTETAFGAPASGSFSGYGGGGTLRAGALLNAGGIGLIPSAGITGLNLHENGTAESGGGTALVVNSNSLSSLQSLVAIRAEQTLALGTMVVIPSVSLGWAHEFMDNAVTTGAQFAATGAAFSVDTPAVGRDAAVVSARADLAAAGGFKVFVGYNGAFSKHDSSNGVTGGVQYSF
jgi:autotransporter-associated beta strand protein